jgi:hypothetical protein
VFPVYSKMPVFKKIMQSRDATFNLGETVQAQIYILYIRLMFGHFESESDIQQKACMEEITQSRDATTDLVWMRAVSNTLQAQIYILYKTDVRVLRK